MKTLGMFAKQPVPGRVKTRLAADWGDDRAAALYECFVRDLLDRFSDCGDRRVIGYSPADHDACEWFQTAATDAPQKDTWQLWPQPETDLGGRISSFFSKWTGAPEHRTILIGSDSPSLPADYLEHAWKLLSDNDCVLGPAADGGYCLIGFRGSVENFAAVFEGIDWSTSAVLGQTVSLIEQQRLSLGVCPPWYDVDSADEVTMLAGHLDALRHAGDLIELPRTSALLLEDVPDA